MATRIAADVVIHQPIGEYERKVIEANRRLAEDRVVRCDYRHLPDGMQRFLKAIHRMESKS